MDNASTRAKAVQLMDQLFKEEKKALSEQLTSPFADKINDYLQCLFGPKVRAKVELNNNMIQGLQIIRPDRGGVAFEFDKLSAGAREQFATAVRLAMAEVLAADHHGSLPLVFDDAFVNSDPDRLTLLHRMLSLASQRGLQVIVLACNPGDYYALGGQTSHLARY